MRQPNGQFMKGYAAAYGADGARARRRLNLSTIEGMQRAFERGGQRAIDQVMEEQPAIFLKMLVLLVPRELEITQTTGVKGMTDDQLESAILAIERMVAQRAAGAGAKVIEAVPGPASAAPDVDAPRDISGTSDS